MGFEGKGLTPSQISQIAKLAGETPVGSSTTANWQTAEADLVSIGANNTKYKVHSLEVGIVNCVGNVTIRVYKQVNGVERQVYTETVSVALDGPAIWVIPGTVGTHEVLRVTCQSDAAGDNGKAITYDYMLEAM